MSSNNDVSDMDLSSSSSQTSTETEDLIDVVQPIPHYMQTVLSEICGRYERSDLRFHGDAALLRWSTDQMCFHTPDRDEAAENALHVGRHWVTYEANGSFVRTHSPAWSLFLEIGVVKEDTAAGGMQIWVLIRSFPAELFAENLYDQPHLVASMEEWTAFKSDILDGTVAQLFKRIEDEVEFGFSVESTEANSEDDRSDGEM
jgi:hypothetical protein